jgi:hypothetical protein
MEYLVAALIGLITSLLAAEFYARATTSSRRIIEKAVLQIPRHERDRYREEWLAHLEEIPGNLGKLAHAFQCLFVAAPGVARAVSKPKRKRVSIAETQRRKMGLVTIKFFNMEVKIVGTAFGRNLSRSALLVFRAMRTLAASGTVRRKFLYRFLILAMMWAIVATALIEVAYHFSK